MLGESVLSLILVVDTLDGDIGHQRKVRTFFLLMLNTFYLQFMHFSM